MSKAECDKRYNEKHKAEIKAQKHKYYLEHKEKTKRDVNLWISNNREKHNEFHVRSKRKLKAEVFSHYCGGGEPKCKCGVTELCILSIDHIAGNGAEHRREIGMEKRGGYEFYQWLKKNNFPEGFQVLCFNCQFRKRKIEMMAENQTHLKEVRARYVRSIKTECLDHYGGCKCSCGEDDMDVLTLDHVNDDGAKHREETGTRGFNFYMMLRKNGFPNDTPLQVMCLNCQFKKRNKNEERKDEQGADSVDAAVAA